MKDELMIKEFIINDKSYYVINEVDYNNSHYVFLSNKFDKEDIMVRRVVDDVLEPLDSEEELIDVLKLFVK